MDQSTYACGIVVVSVNRKARDGDVDVGILVIDVSEGIGGEVDDGIAEKLERGRSVTVTVLAQ